MSNITVVSEFMSELEVSAFPTALGWFGLIGFRGNLVGVQIGHRDRQQVIDAARERCGHPDMKLRATHWNLDLRSRVEQFAHGSEVDFSDVVIAYPAALPAFRQRVIEATRAIPFGQTVTYLQLATMAGSPKAARAVGSAMSSNRFPLIVPCHRVLGSCGQLGGFTAPGGLDLKRRMLDLESSDKQSD